MKCERDAPFPFIPELKDMSSSSTFSLVQVWREQVAKGPHSLSLKILRPFQEFRLFFADPSLGLVRQARESGHFPLDEEKVFKCSPS